MKLRVFFQEHGKRIGATLRFVLTFGAGSFMGSVLLVYLGRLSPQERGIAWLGILAFVMLMVGLAHVANWTGFTAASLLLRHRYGKEAEQYLREFNETQAAGIDTLEAFANATDEQRMQFIPPEPSWYYPSVGEDTPEDPKEP